MCYIDGQKNKYSVLNECNRMLKYNIFCLRVVYYFRRPCGLVVRVPGYRSRGPGSITDATRLSEKYCVWNGVHSASLSTTEELLARKSTGSGLESIEYGRGDPLR
jgi:hypothetical protein